MSAQAKPSITGLIRSIVDDVVALARGHVDLAKAELRQSVRIAAFAIVALTIALAMVNLAVIMGFIAAVYAIAESGYPLWQSFLMVAGALLVLAVLMLLFGIARLRRAARPSLTAKSLAATRDTFLGGPRTNA